MNLQENIRRILKEETITKTFQDIINKTLDEIKNICDVVDADTFPGWLSFDGCDVSDSIDKISIVNVEKINGSSNTPRFKLYVNLTLSITPNWIDYNDFMYDIANRIFNKWKIRFIFIIEEKTYNNKREMWESGKHKNINESTFFHRRIKLDDVKQLLKDYAYQVYHETNNYDQFKYELTLKSVESIMWMDYQLGWEDLPEQEEIEFVTEVSDMLEDNIKRFYDYYKIRK